MAEPCSRDRRDREALVVSLLPVCRDIALRAPPFVAPADVTSQPFQVREQRCVVDRAGIQHNFQIATGILRDLPCMQVRTFEGSGRLGMNSENTSLSRNAHIEVTRSIDRDLLDRKWIGCIIWIQHWQTGSSIDERVTARAS